MNRDQHRIPYVGDIVEVIHPNYKAAPVKAIFLFKPLNVDDCPDLITTDVTCQIYRSYQLSGPFSFMDGALLGGFSTNGVYHQSAGYQRERSNSHLVKNDVDLDQFLFVNVNTAIVVNNNDVLLEIESKRYHAVK